MKRVQFFFVRRGGVRRSALPVSKPLALRRGAGNATMRFLRTIIALSALAGISFTPIVGQTAGNQTMLMSTTLGEIKIELYSEAAPVSVRNFVDYVESGYFDNLIFHRVIPGFMVQGGGFTSDMNQRKTQPPIKNEADNGLKNLVGTLAMARTSDPNSATAQFFINLVDNAFLDHTAKTPQGWGYAVFGKVVSGMDVVEKIAAQPTGSVSSFQDVPKEPVVILKVEILEQ